MDGAKLIGGSIEGIVVGILVNTFFRHYYLWL
jgi:hypothetical protein